MVDIQITEPDLVGAALRSESLAPPVAPATLGNGSTAELRDAMARFSHGPVHRRRRTAVEDAVGRLDLAALTALARRHTEAVLGPPGVEAMQVEAMRVEGMKVEGMKVEGMSEVGFVVPTRVMAEALGTAAAELDEVRVDVLAVVSAIGRQEPATEQTDAAVDRLMQRFAAHPDGPVAAISLLYQNHDATAALLASTVVASTVLASADDEERRPALPRTVRSATAPVVIGDAAIGVGDTVVLSLDSPVNEFGAGAHECPGRAAAESIVGGMAAELAAAGYRLDVGAMDRGDDGRASTLPMVSSPRR